MELDVIEDEGKRIGLVRIQGDFGRATLDEFRRHLGALMVPGKDIKHYVMDFKLVETFDRSVTGGMLSVLKHIREMQGDIRLSNLQPEVRTILSYAKVDEIFHTYETRGEAVRSYRNNLSKEE
jgi:anti-anti-sigma factor